MGEAIVDGRLAPAMIPTKRIYHMDTLVKDTCLFNFP